MTRARTCALAAALAALLGAPGCGGGRAVEFSVDGDKTISSLTPEERATMCTEMAPQLQTANEMVCLIEGVGEKFGGGDTAACKATYSACLAEDREIECPLGGTQPASFVATCEATVAEMEDCLNDMLDLLEDLRSKLSCSMTIGDFVGIDTSKFEEMPPSCERVNTKCPGFLEGEDIAPAPPPGG